MRKHQLGAVMFARRRESEDGSGSSYLSRIDLVGAARRAALQQAKDGGPMPEGWLLVAQNDGGLIEITRYEVEWGGLRS